MKSTDLFRLIILLLLGNTALAQTSPDTLFAGRPLSGNSRIQSGDIKYIMLIHTGNTYSSIKYLDERTERTGNKLTIVQKLYNGTYINTDSVLLDAQTLTPLESYSDINTSKDSFKYVNNTISGTMLLREGPQKGTTQNIDTLFPHPLFNGLSYTETFQALSFQKGKPFILAEYVPGHNTKYSRLEYVKDEDLDLSGVHFQTKLIEEKIGTITIRCWLNATNQELLKIEGHFPSFDYQLLRVL